MNIVISGAAGQIGSLVGQFLQRLGHNIKFIDNLSNGSLENLNLSHNEFIKADCRDKDFHKYLNGCDVFLHCAAITSLPECELDKLAAYDNNVIATINMLNACRKVDVKQFIFCSTSAVYERNKKTPFEEDDPIAPRLSYSLTKKHCEDIVNSYNELYGMNTTILRLFNVYSARGDMHRKSPPLITYIIKCLLDKEAPILHSDGKQERDYIHIEDCCEFIELVIDSKLCSGQTFNVCSNSVVSVNKICEEVYKYFPNAKKPIFRSPELLWDKYNLGILPEIIATETNKFSYGCNDKAGSVLGWYPKVKIEDGLLKIVLHYTK